MPATNDLQFLTSVQVPVTWVAGTGKVIPSNIGNVPSDTINAGNTYSGLPQVLCSQGGYIGWVYQNMCSIGVSGLGTENSTVLVGDAE
jgi:hypothetical protein